jgi:invasion protein IalB
MQRETHHGLRAAAGAPHAANHALSRTPVATMQATHGLWERVCTHVPRPCTRVRTNHGLCALAAHMGAANHGLRARAGAPRAAIHGL